jgi:hypothetical protein
MRTPISIFVNWLKKLNLHTISADTTPDSDMEVGPDGQSWDKGQGIDFPGD